MSAMRADRLDADRRSRLKNIELDDSIVDVLVAHLSEEAAKEFNSQLIEALAKAKKNDDVTPINEVIESWYRTLAFATKEGFLDARKKALNPRRKRRGRPVEEVLKKQ